MEPSTSLSGGYEVHDGTENVTTGRPAVRTR